MAHPDEYNNALKGFMERLESAKWRPSGQSLDRLLKKEDLVNMLDFVLGGGQNHMQGLLEQLNKLRPGHALHLDKVSTKLPRTLNILRDRNGEYMLIVETKSKLRGGEKQDLPKIGGTSKSGKPAWRVDGSETEYFNLVAKPYDQYQLNQIRDEVRISYKMACETVNLNVIGKVFQKVSKRKLPETKVSIYSVKTQGSLEDLLKSPEVLSEKQKNILITDLLTGIKQFHDTGYAHQDLKPSNLLVYRDAKGDYRLKLTDFGNTRKAGDDCPALTTAGYHSPEMDYYHDSSLSDYNRYYRFFNQECPDNLMHYYFSQNPQLYPRNGSTREDFKKPHLSNDMWAAGMIAFEIKHGKIPEISSSKQGDYNLIQQDPLLKNLLVANRSQRLDCNAALQKMHQVKPEIKAYRRKAAFNLEAHSKEKAQQMIQELKDKQDKNRGAPHKKSR